ncbi:hypothetical protein M408DRAFT_23910 [Serendipita vermifera MAFF 305830]|uniref:3'-5' exonuclease domain-containing protein n=1 Tax=Serendipita vermifera MAFF 305830 TaxID=933852 RepID=A0A0C3B7W0_SERVB|nr:hypothetical protein M408DRAFT_23910 [Serendipita vermifera MAFF 305830]
MQGAFKEPASRFGPVVSASPSRISKSTRVVYVPPQNSSLALKTQGGNRSLRRFIFTRPTGAPSSTVSTVSTVSVPNALQLSKGPPRASKRPTSTSKKVKVPNTVDRAAQHHTIATPTATSTGSLTATPPATPTATLPDPIKPTKAIKSSAPVQKHTPVEDLKDDTKAVDPPPELPVYDYCSYKPTPTRKYARTIVDAERELGGMFGPLGFDIEWRVMHRKGVPPRPVAIVQIADRKKILIIQTSAMKTFPKKLKEILEDATIVKTGDAKKMFTDHKIKVQNLVELSWLSRQADTTLRCGGKVSAKTLVSLPKLAAAYLGKNLLKNDARTSNWEALLTEQQLKYAANDAHCSIILYHYFLELAEGDQRTLEPQAYTMNVNLAGEVVMAAKEVAMATKEVATATKEVTASKAVEEANVDLPAPLPRPAPVKPVRPVRKQAFSTRPPEITESESESVAQLHLAELATFSASRGAAATPNALSRSRPYAGNASTNLLTTWREPTWRSLWD